MDLTNAFFCIPHDSLIAKFHTYGLTFDTVTFVVVPWCSGYHY